MKRSGFKVMARLVGLVRPLAGYMVLAVRHVLETKKEKRRMEGRV